MFGLRNSDHTYLKLDIDNHDIMENRLQSQIQEAIDEFSTMASQITPSPRRVDSSKDKKTNVNQNMIKNALLHYKEHPYVPNNLQTALRQI